MKYKSIEELENDYWIEPKQFPTELVKTIFQLRKKVLQDFSANDLRIMISQSVGLKYTVPIGIKMIEENIKIDNSFWGENPDAKRRLEIVLKTKASFIKTTDLLDKESKGEFSNFISKFI